MIREIEFNHTFLGVDVTKNQFLKLYDALKNRDLIESAERKNDLKHLTNGISNVRLSRMILDAVSIASGVTTDAMQGMSRVGGLILARKVSAFLMVKYTSMSFTEIGYLIKKNGKSTTCPHSAISYYMKVFDVNNERIANLLDQANKELIKQLT